MAIRGTISRAELRQVAAATYTQIWWPPTDTVVYSGTHLPYWDPHERTYVDPDTHQPLTTWDEAVRALDDEGAEPLHVGRFGRQIDAKGVMAGSPDSDQCIGYITKYLVKDIAECREQGTPAQADHTDRLLEALRFEPCSPTCANWLRNGIQTSAWWWWQAAYPAVAFQDAQAGVKVGDLFEARSAGRMSRVVKRVLVCYAPSRRLG
jgi:hypothetical protein